jgi:hypothetical protein
VQWNLVEAFQQIEHRTVFIVEETPRDLHDVVRRDANEILVECTVVDRAQAKTIPYRCLAAMFKVGNDVSGIEQPSFLQRADGALTAISRKNSTPEPCLVEPNACLSNGVPTFDGVV